MNKRDDGESVVDINCFCGGKHCKGNLYVQADKVNGEDCFMVTVIGTNGYEEGSLWLSPTQVEQLVNELKILLEENINGFTN
jgi:hypothetical protein